MGDTTFFMAGIGYEWNNWLRFDVTGGYRSKPVNALGIYTFGGTDMAIRIKVICGRWSFSPMLMSISAPGTA